MTTNFIIQTTDSTLQEYGINSTNCKKQQIQPEQFLRKLLFVMKFEPHMHMHQARSRICSWPFIMCQDSSVSIATTLQVERM
jgi:hypothetical protein